MKYLHLIYHDEQKNMSTSPEAMDKKMEEWFKYTDGIWE